MIKDELQEIQSYLEITLSEDPNEAIDRGNTLSVYIARTGKILADAKCDLDKKMASEIVSQIAEAAKKIEWLSSKAVNTIVDSLCAEERFIVNWTERLNRTATHQLDWCRTLVSKAKADQYYSSGVRG